MNYLDMAVNDVDVIIDQASRLLQKTSDEGVKDILKAMFPAARSRKRLSALAKHVALPMSVQSRAISRRKIPSEHPTSGALKGVFH